MRGARRWVLDDGSQWDALAVHVLAEGGGVRC